MAAGGSCPNCGKYLTISVTKGQGSKKCNGCGATVVFIDGKPAGTR